LYGPMWTRIKILPTTFSATLPQQILSKCIKLLFMMCPERDENKKITD